MTRNNQDNPHALLCLAIRALARRGVPLVLISRAGGYDFEMEGKPASERDVLMRASLLDFALFARMHGDQLDEVRLAA